MRFLRCPGFWILVAGAWPGVMAGPSLADAEALYRQGLHESARVAFERVLAEKPDEPAAHFRLGLLALRADEKEQAVSRFERAVALAPACADYRHWLGNGYAWLAAGASLSEKVALGRKCREAYLRALEIDPDHLPARIGLMNFHRHVPRYLGGGLGRARAETAEITRRDPVVGRYAEAVLLGHEKRYAEAFSVLAGVVRDRPGYYAAQSLIGRLALESGQRQEEGVVALQRCLDLTPADTDESIGVVAERLALLSGRPIDRGEVASRLRREGAR